MNKHIGILASARQWALSLSVAALIASPPAQAGEAPAADAGREFSQIVPLSECHGLWWLNKAGRLPTSTTATWQIDPAQWAEAVRQKGEGKTEDCDFHLWMPTGIDVIKGVVAISGHGSGLGLYRNADLRQIARELRLGLFMFLGNPVQRGFWPPSLFYERLGVLGRKAGHPEVDNAPLFLYGHSNGTGFAAIFPATESHRVWAWVSMRPGAVAQLEQSGAAHVPGLIMFGEDDKRFKESSPGVIPGRASLDLVEKMRKDHGALWHCAIEPKTGHAPTRESWPLVFSFLRHSWKARVPADCDPRKGPVPLVALRAEEGLLGRNWDCAKGGYQVLAVAPYGSFPGDRSVASWLLNADYARDWQQFQRDGRLGANVDGPRNSSTAPVK